MDEYFYYEFDDISNENEKQYNYSKKDEKVEDKKIFNIDELYNYNDYYDYYDYFTNYE